jgi:transposase-like protein
MPKLLHKEKLPEVKKRLSRGESITALAKEYGMNPGYVWELKHGRKRRNREVRRYDQWSVCPITGFRTTN